MRRHVVFCAIVLIVEVLGSRGVWAQPELIEVPAGATHGLFANLWFELYEGSSTPTFEPVPYLAPDTNYLLVLDMSAIRYDNTELQRPGVISIPIPILDPGQISQVVIEDETYHAPSHPHFFVHRYRANIIKHPDMRGQLEWIAAVEKTAVNSDAFDILGTADDEPAWVVERHVFRIGVKNRLGEAPLAIAFRDPDGGYVLRVVSTRFCVAEREDQCWGLPRKSEYLEAEIAYNPPPLPDQNEFVGSVRLSYGEGDADKSWAWNSWVFRTGDAARAPQAIMLLEDNGIEPEYTLQIDASLYIYEKIFRGSPIGGTTPDPALSKLVKRLLSQKQKTITFTIRAEAIGHAVEIAGQQTHHIVVDLTKLDPDEAQPDLSNAKTLRDLSNLVSAAQIEISLDPRTVGCGAVAISITDKSGVRPLDHLVHSFEVVSSPSDPRNCPSADISTVLTAGMHNLLTHGNAPPVDASLHIFEQFAVDSGKKTAAFLYGVNDEPFSWEIDPPLSEYLADPKNLESRIFTARELTKNGTEHSYGIVATTLANAIFAATDPAEQKKADAARTALQAFVDRSPKPPTFLVRFTDRRGDIMFLPFGLLGAPGPKAFLQKPLHVILPLPKEDYGESGCLGKWSVAVSDMLDGADIKVPIDIQHHPNWLGESFENLRDYLTTQKPAQNEGFIVVAHNDGGRLRYADNDFELHVNELTRAYGVATVGVLAMCKAGGVSPVDRRLYEKLNNFGLDAAIISPFSLDANYGKAFAIEFSRVVSQSSTAGRDDTLLDLFNKSVSATATAMRNHNNPYVVGSVGDMGLELILVGNPALRLCNRP